ncbi:MAG: methyltransferase domain-containing protein [Deltaproteobacteria bacterium]|nr:methyltransferase domain-containing protein [Deltaproteobacteria bacterium]
MNPKTYSWNSDDYRKHSSVQYEWAQELIKKLGLTGEESVIDIGCGDGKVSALLSSRLRNGKVTGIDSSPDMITLARKNYPPSKYPNLSFVLLEATKLNFSKQFDITFSNAALHWVKDQMAVLKGVKEGLKKSGRIVFQMGGQGNARDIIASIETLIQNGKWQPYFDGFSFPYTFCSPDEYKQWLKTVGLSPKRLELIPKDMTHKGRDGLAGWIRTTWLPYTERIPENQRNIFIDDLINAYNERFPMGADGLFHIKMVRLEVEAVNP